MAACDWQAATVVLTGQDKLTVGALITVNVLLQVTGASQPLVTVNVTVTEPPQALGGPGLLWVSTPLQPPVKVACASHARYLLVIAACDWQAASVVTGGQVSITLAGASTVKLDEQVAELLQSSVMV
jgi:hypothetical protein